MGGDTSVSLVKGGHLDFCEKCAGFDELATLVVKLFDQEGNTLEQTEKITICATCLAEGVQLATGFRVVRQLAAWRKMRGMSYSRRIDG